MKHYSRRDFILKGSQNLALLGAGGLLTPAIKAKSHDRKSVPQTNKTGQSRIVSTNLGGPWEEIQLPGLKVRLGTPRVVAETSIGRYFFPDLLKFSTGELMLNHSLNADSLDNQFNAQAVYISNDDGRSFDFSYDVNGFHGAGGEPRISLPDGRIVGASYFLKPDPLGQWRDFATHWWVYDHGGSRYSVEPWAVKITGLPRDVEPQSPITRVRWALNWWAGDIVIMDNGRWVSHIGARFKGDKRDCTMAIASNDQGRHWRYLSMVAGPGDIADATEGFNEPCLIRLADGDLMCISRVGNYHERLARTYSIDGGNSWSKIDRLPAWSVLPQIQRLKNGVLALSTGRPGIFLWFSTDPRGKNWQSVDLAAHHNRVLGKDFCLSNSREEAFPDWNAAKILDHLTRTYKLNQEQSAAMACWLKSDNDEPPPCMFPGGEYEKTTAYTAMVEMEDNKIFLVYDRSPLGWHPLPAGSSERSQIYLLEIQVL